MERSVAVNVSRSRQRGLGYWPFSILLGILLGCTAGNLQAQQRPTAVRTFLTNPADEDWSFLSDPSRRSDFADPLKYVSLGREGRYLTLSAEIRYRVEGLRIRGVGENPSTFDGYLLQRYIAGADLHLSPRLRIYFEFQSGIINGKLASPRPTDQDPAGPRPEFLGDCRKQEEPPVQPGGIWLLLPQCRSQARPIQSGPGP